MAKIEIYTTKICPYCDRAKKLMTDKGETYTEYRVDQDNDLRDEMLARSGGVRTVPQIFINGVHVGGCDDLYQLDRDGKLNPMLKGDNDNGGTAPGSVRPA